MLYIIRDLKLQSDGGFDASAAREIHDGDGVTATGGMQQGRVRFQRRFATEEREARRHLRSPSEIGD